MPFIHLALGTNVGARMRNLHIAIEHLRQYFKNLYLSIVLDNKAILPPNAPATFDLPYLNMVVYGELLDASMRPQEFLRIIKEVECCMGRPAQYERASPRIIDIDILLWGDLIMRTPNLSIPHLGMYEPRKFIWHLLGLIDPSLRVPVLKNTIENTIEGVVAGEHEKIFVQDMLGSFGNAPEDIADCFFDTFVLSPSIFGVVNLDPQSTLSKGDYGFDSDIVVQYIDKVIAAGAMVIDIGGVATNPGVQDTVSEEEEWIRISPILNALKTRMADGLQISIDTIHPNTAYKALSAYKVAWINDQTGRLDEDLMRHLALSGCGIVSNHTLSIPANYDIVMPMSKEKSVVATIIEWMLERGEFLLRCGFKHEKIILDPGIGFGKTMYQSWFILRNIGQISAEVRKKHGYNIMVGHSRKSFIGSISHDAPCERDIETAQISAKIAPHVDYLRVHNVDTVMRCLVTNALLSMEEV